MQTQDGIKKIMKLRSKGHYCGGHIPYGFEVVDGKLEPSKMEQEALSMAVELRKLGGTWTSIGETLANMGYYPRRNEKWNPAVLSKLVRTSQSS